MVEKMPCIVQQCQGFGAPFCERHERAPSSQRAAWIGAAKRRLQQQGQPRKAPAVKIARHRGIWFGPENAKTPANGEFGVVIFVGGEPRARDAYYQGAFHYLALPLQLRQVAPAIYSTAQVVKQRGKVLICGRPEACLAVVAELTKALHVTPGESNQRRWRR